ncbi:hypothetical protein BVC93_06745 [Mycobacterium sp. MS1601]|uniref:glycosyltransferase family 4 protein n=1 Tax=Mycobacterium sp. MS1601 TaxID=1936029 RepID=UPI00097940A3|nr:glycosyltransferase family 4 protein [Mycobacterium sp. MS1601]AQA02176.1 hypothetical protein BVC93_06745 [Mycobacterium sp. MS1601]
MRVAILGPSRHPVGEPYQGGQERFTADLARGLSRRGHHVELYARTGTDTSVAECVHLMPELPPLSEITSGDPTLPEPSFLHDQTFYVSALREILRRNDFDAVLNESLHQLPLAMSPLLDVPMVTTLHTPPFAWLELGAWLSGEHAQFVAVSEAVRRQWAGVAPARVIHNGVDPDRFPVGRGGTALAWVGRLTPEKGADLAIRIAARTGRQLRIAGPVSDPAWFDAVIRPALGARVTYVGALGGVELASLYASSAATLVTPRWEEPFCLVAVESQMCGTPVVGIRRGGLPEVVDGVGGRLVPTAGDGIGGLAEAVEAVVSNNRDVIAQRARRDFSLNRMVADYEQLLFALGAHPTAALVERLRA